MTTFTDFQPNELDRFRLYNQGNRVFCNKCWWVGADDNYDQCPECFSDRLEWIFDDEKNDVGINNYFDIDHSIS